jgi:hypothetical protein
MWTNLARHLEEFDFQLVLLSTAPVESPLPFPVLPIPFLLRDYATQFPGATVEGGHYSPGDWDIACADSSRSHGAYPPAEAIPGLQVCRSVLRTILKTLQPGFVLTWDSTSPLARVAHGLCLEAGMPVQSLERGLLPETLMIESRGIQGHSDLRTHWLAQEISAAEPSAYERVRSFYVNRKPQKYQQPEFNGGGAQLREEWKLGAKKAVMFFGHYDPCGLTPADGAQRRYHSPAFASTEDLLMSLGALLKNSTDCALIFKPHPLDKNPYAAAAAQGTRIVNDVNVHALMDLASVVVAQFTTLQFEAALYEKPVLLAGRSAWWGRGATYEVARREDLGSGLLAALRGEDWAARSANARVFLTWIMEHWLIGCSSVVPARRNLSELAKFLATTSLEANADTSAEKRVASAQKQFESWRTIAIASTPVASESSEVLRERAEVLRQLASWESAAEIYRTLSNQFPDDLEIWQKRIECATRAGQKFVAGLLRGDALRAHPEWADKLDNVIPTRG